MELGLPVIDALPDDFDPPANYTPTGTADASPAHQDPKATVCLSSTSQD
jgi:hypothetical protein